MTPVSFTGACEARTDQGITDAAKKIGCEEDALLAVIAVETAGKGFDAQGRVKALFEPHRFYALLTGAKRAAAVKQGLAYAKWGTKPYPRDSYARIAAAVKIDEEAALKATSWGLGQIMGENCRACGFPTARAMLEAFKDSEDAQIMGMANFIVKNGLAKHLKSKNWKAFAQGYNGPGYVKNHYDTKLQAAYAHLSGPGTMARGLLSDVQSDDQVEDDAPAVDPDADSTSGADEVDKAFDNPPTEPDPIVPPPLPREKVRKIQERLQALNYAMVGKADGAFGASTVAAIAAFQHDHEIEVTGKLDPVTEEALWEEQEPREIPEARAAAKVAEVAERVPAVKENWLSKIWAAVLAGLSGFAAMVQGVLENIPGAQDMAGNVKAAFGSIPGWAYAAIVAAIAAFIWHKSHRSEQEAVKDFRTGRTS